MSYLNSFKKIMDEKTKKKKDEKEQTSETANVGQTAAIKTASKSAADAGEKQDTKVVTNDASNQNQKKIKTLVSGMVDLEATKDDNPEVKLKELDDRYELLEFYDVPDSLGLEERSVPTYDEEETRNKITGEIEKVYDQKKAEKQDEYKQALLDIQNEMDNAEIESGAKAESIKQVYDEQSFNLENQAIKRGLARSSVILLQLSNVENNKAEKLIENMNNLSSKIAGLENQIQTQKTKLDEALENLDIEKADKIEKEIQDAYDDYKKAYDEAIEFNNNVKKLEAEYKIKYEQAKVQNKEDVLNLSKYGYDEYRKKLEMAKYNYMVSYLSQFNKDDAFEIFFRNSNFKDLLGDNYQKIVDYLYSRL